MTRIAFIGAGSVVFTKNLLGDILEHPALHEVEIALHDIDPDRLETAEAMARWVARRRGAEPADHDPRRPARRDRGLGLRPEHGADRWPRGDVRDFEIPARYGLRQSISDTLGVGGIFRACARPPTCSRSADEMAELLPARRGS